MAWLYERSCGKGDVTAGYRYKMHTEVLVIFWISGFPPFSRFSGRADFFLSKLGGMVPYIVGRAHCPPGRRHGLWIVMEFRDFPEFVDRANRQA